MLTEVSRGCSSLGCNAGELCMEVSMGYESCFTIFFGKSSGGVKDISVSGVGSISSVASWHCCRFKNFSRLNFVVEILKTCSCSYSLPSGPSELIPSRTWQVLWAVSKSPAWEESSDDLRVSELVTDGWWIQFFTSEQIYPRLRLISPLVWAY